MKPVPMLDLKREYEYLKEDIDRSISRCLDHQRWVLGPEVAELEQRFAEYLGSPECIGVSSGTEALVLALRALAIKRKGKEFFDTADRVITTPFTFTATGDAILRAGATPLFVDIDPVTFTIDPVRIRERLAASGPQGSQVVGILPVHLYGRSCDMDQIMDIADDHGLFVVEDVAQAAGAAWKGRKLGTIGDAGAFSFFPSKNLGGFGDGGMVSVNDHGLGEVVRMLLKHGGRDKYNADYLGYNARLDTLQAAILLAKLRHLDEFNECRRQIAERYADGLADLPGFILPLRPFSQLPSDVRGSGSGTHVFHQFTLRVLGGRRSLFQGYLKASGIETMIYYPVPLHRMRLFSDGKGERFGDLSGSERAAEEVVSLPMGPLMDYEEVLVVLEKVGQYVSATRGTSRVQSRPI